MFGDPSGLAPEPIQKGGGIGDVLLGDTYASNLLASIMQSAVASVSFTYRIPVFGFYWDVDYREEIVVEKEGILTRIKQVWHVTDVKNYGLVGYETVSRTETGGGGPSGGGEGSGSIGGGGSASGGANGFGGADKYGAAYNDNSTIEDKIDEIGNLFKIDAKGNKITSLIVLLDTEGANGFSHLAIILPDEKGNLHYYSKDGTLDPGGIAGESIWEHKVYENSDHSPKMVMDFINQINEDREGDRAYDKISYVELTNPDLELLKLTAAVQIESYYDVLTNSCAHTLFSVIWANRLDRFGQGERVINHIKNRAGKSSVFPPLIPRSYYNDYKPNNIPYHGKYRR